MATAISLPVPDIAEPNLKRRLARAERMNRLKSKALILPLLVFLLLTFVLPIASLLWRSVDNPEVVGSLPRTVEAIAAWDGRGLPEESVYRALSEDLLEARQNQSLGDLSKRLNMEQAGFRSLMTKTARALPFKELPTSYKEALETFDERWGDPAYWQVIRRNDSALTPYYLLAALDHRIDDMGELAPVSPDQAVYLDIFARTFWMGLVITAICLVLAYPLAYLLANLPARKSNLLMIMVLLPFWTSILVRVAAWIVLLQSSGLINGALLKMGLIDEPLQLVFNRAGVYIAMVHILLPFMILPIYSVMKNISPSYMRAAISLGCHPFASFWRVYFPQTLAGVAAGCLLVFIISIGYYITPALLGSPNDQMVSYFVAFYTNTTINWGMATALGGLLLLATMLLYVVYSWLVGASRLRLG
ncbi:ABC transporter permease [Pseudomonas sp. Choline-3u-10]|jgi:putative spermidine/putrescine transport system permease protein|uniref:ABC transporter permease n=1 Tax=Pseudomonadaceae TaxID=135621 RepID=UPI0006180DB1|nr:MULTISPECIES: ABC transporter permease [Pseudomonadaceae]MAL34666.1 ABC transporter permease [Pseudomonas sp.]MBU0947372.1 ABC transporter permease [Gammaproteobacteria bacterium]KJJ62839.1 polyamine ABC transporter substrate-binding protein [Pseudomonas sp. 10B238]MBK3797492.1 ABC transporter permease subunit [Stutzerimonas stutzeri]MBK3876331.1 ABC transporter permease subunit [Stutzerimonas stutzeri]|tara:strand:- start:333 stop:1586 length:1254 start_codon:yes stop_codon:yes gene_type:complete